MAEDNTPWFDGFDAETKGYMINRGLDKLPVGEAFQKVVEFHRNAESKLGGPADKMVRWPDEGDAAGWAAIHQRLGVPAKAEDYDLAGVKFADGKEPEAEFVTWVRNMAHELRLPPAAAKEMAQKFISFGEAAEQKSAGEGRLRAAMEQDQLKLLWGGAFDQNKFIADRAAAMLGLSAENLNTMANVAGFAKVMDGLRKVGVAMGEAKLLGVNEKPGGGPGPNTPMTREEALSALTELKSDRNFVTRWMQGDPEAKKRLEDLTRLAVGPQPKF